MMRRVLVALVGAAQLTMNAGTVVLPPTNSATAQAPMTAAPVTRARALIAADSSSEAIAVLNEAIKSGPDNALYHLWLAAAYSADGAHANFGRQLVMTLRVKNELLRAVSLDSTSVDARSELARFYLTAPFILGGSFSRASEEARKLLPVSPGRAHGLLGFLAHHQGDIKTAELEMRLAVAASPDSAWSYTGLAFLMGEQQRNDEAFALWQKTVALDSTFKDSYFQMGVIGAATGTHLNEAAVALEHYVSSPPPSADKKNRASANNKLGVIYEKLRRPTDARRAYRNATLLAPTNTAYKASLKNLG